MPVPRARSTQRKFSSTTSGRNSLALLRPTPTDPKEIPLKVSTMLVVPDPPDAVGRFPEVTLSREAFEALLELTADRFFELFRTGVAHLRADQLIRRLVLG